MPHVPIIKSAIKRVDVTKTKTLRNRMIKSNLHTTHKKLDAAIAANDAAAVQTELRSAVSAYDKAASKGVMHKNAVNRKKAQLAKAAAAVK